MDRSLALSQLKVKDYIVIDHNVYWVMWIRWSRDGNRITVTVDDNSHYPCDFTFTKTGKYVGNEGRILNFIVPNINDQRYDELVVEYAKLGIILPFATYVTYDEPSEEYRKINEKQSLDCPLIVPVKKSNELPARCRDLTGRSAGLDWKIIAVLCFTFLAFLAMFTIGK